MIDFTDLFNRNAMKTLRDMFNACKVGDSNTLKRIVDEITNPEREEYFKLKGITVNSKDVRGETPLHMAAHYEYGMFGKADGECAKILIAAGADVNARDIYGETPLFGTTFRDNVDSAKLLIKSGAEVNVRNMSGNSPLHMAAYWGAEDVVKVLLKAGADPLAVNVHKSTPRDETRYQCHLAVEEILKRAEAKVKRAAKLQAKI